MFLPIVFFPFFGGKFIPIVFSSLLFLSKMFLQSVEEAECRKAYDSATETYMSTFDRSKPPEEVSVALS